LPVISVVGIGADGWAGLSEPGRQAVLRADTIVGSERQLGLIPDGPARRRTWPSPIDPLVEELAGDGVGSVCVLASGDPMLFGIGATLARRLDPDRLRVHPHPSAFALACARLGWPEAEVELISAVGSPLAAVARLLQPGRRIVVYLAGVRGAGELAALLRDRGFGPSRFVVLEQLGGDRERVLAGTAAAWNGRDADPLHAVAIECQPEDGALVLGSHPGLPDLAFDHDGQITKWPVRAVTLAALHPLPGQLLWDVGAGSGSVSIEWLRAEPRARALAVERDPVRAERIAANAERLGVPQLEVVVGSAPGALAELKRPDAVFVGGGLSAPGVLKACADTGARVVANAVTLQGEQAVRQARERFGGSLMRLELSHAEPLGRLEAWRAQLPIVQWCLR
jgi:precorrin-6Y C5,15-methyltransferase (decarboxylating)